MWFNRIDKAVWDVCSGCMEREYELKLKGKDRDDDNVRDFLAGAATGAFAAGDIELGRRLDSLCFMVANKGAGGVAQVVNANGHRSLGTWSIH